MCLTVRQTGRTGAKAGFSDLVFDRGIGTAYRIKATPGICYVSRLHGNMESFIRLITVESIILGLGLYQHREEL